MTTATEPRELTPTLLVHDILLALEDRERQARTFRDKVAQQVADAYDADAPYMTDDEEARLESYRLASVARWAEAHDALTTVQSLVAPASTEPF